MKLDEIIAGETVVVDANIVLYASQQKSEQSIAFLHRCVTEELHGVVPTHILAEVMHVLMLLEAKENGWITGSNPARQLSENPQRVAALRRYEMKTKDLLNLGLIIEPVLQKDFIMAMKVQNRLGLLTNDALLVAVARRLQIRSLATADHAFARIPGMQIFSPEDVLEG